MKKTQRTALKHFFRPTRFLFLSTACLCAFAFLWVLSALTCAFNPADLLGNGTDPTTICRSILVFPPMLFFIALFLIGPGGPLMSLLPAAVPNMVIPIVMVLLSLPWIYLLLCAVRFVYDLYHKKRKKPVRRKKA